MEKAAANAVMAGCRPEYFPVVLAVIETALDPRFSMHGLLATLWFSGPVIIVNGPIAKRIGMNSQGNALGQGNRANATIGRALQLVIRNVGGGVPGGVDRAVFGNPGKYTFCFAEDEADPTWTPLNVARGFKPGTSTVTLFHGDGVQGISAGKSRTPEELSKSLAMGLAAVCHPKLAEWSGAILVISPDHYAIFQQGGWGRAEIEAGLKKALRRPGRDLVQGAHGVGRRYRSLAREGHGGQVQRGHPARGARGRARRPHVRGHRRLGRAEKEDGSATSHTGDSHMIETTPDRPTTCSTRRRSSPPSAARAARRPPASRASPSD